MSKSKALETTRVTATKGVTLFYKTRQDDFCFQEVAILPGINQIADDVLMRVIEYPIFSAYVDAGVLTVGDGRGEV